MGIRFDQFQKQMLSVCGLARKHDGPGAPFVASAAAMRVGAGRPHALRCVTAAAFALLSVAAQRAGLLTASDAWSCLCDAKEEPDEEDAAAYKRYHELACGLRPVLQCVVGSLPASLQAECPNGVDSPGHVARAFERCPSPVDVAAALSASLAAVYGVLSLHLHPSTRMGGFCEGVMGSDWVTLLAACAVVLNGLSIWLRQADAASSGSGSGSSGNSSASQQFGAGDSSSDGQGWSEVHERWRAALQEYGVMNAAARVRGTWV